MARHDARLKRLAEDVKRRELVARSADERDERAYAQLALGWKIRAALIADDPERRKAGVAELRHVLETEGSEAGERRAMSMSDALLDETRSVVPPGQSIASAFFPNQEEYHAFRAECEAAVADWEATR